MNGSTYCPTEPPTPWERGCARRGHVPTNPAGIAKAPRLEEEEALGLHWEDVDLDAGYVRIRKNRLRPKYAHGCGGSPCGRKAGYCPQRAQTRREHKSTKSGAGRRMIGLPDPLISSRLSAGTKRRRRGNRSRPVPTGRAKGYVFASPTGGPLSPNTDFHIWKRLLREAGVRDGRLHDARHTAATVLCSLGFRTSSWTRSWGGNPGERPE